MKAATLFWTRKWHNQARVPLTCHLVPHGTSTQLPPCFGRKASSLCPVLSSTVTPVHKAGMASPSIRLKSKNRVQMGAAKWLRLGSWNSPGHSWSHELTQGHWPLILNGRKWTDLPRFPQVLPCTNRFYSYFHWNVFWSNNLAEESSPNLKSTTQKQEEYDRFSAAITSGTFTSRVRVRDVPGRLGRLRQKLQVLPRGLEVVSQPVERGPHRVSHKQPHGLQAVLLVKHEAVVYPDEERDHVSCLPEDADPPVLFIPHVEVLTGVQDVASLVIQV